MHAAGYVLCLSLHAVSSPGFFPAGLQLLLDVSVEWRVGIDDFTIKLELKEVYESLLDCAL